MKVKLLVCAVASVGISLQGLGVDASAYVQSGLIAQWDGIENVGACKHSSSSPVWRDLKGNYDLTVTPRAGDVGGEWGETYLDVAGCSAVGAVAAPDYKTIEVVYRMTDASGKILFCSGDAARKRWVGFDSSGTKAYFNGAYVYAPAVSLVFSAEADCSVAATYNDDNVVSNVYNGGMVIESPKTARINMQAGDGVIMLGDRKKTGANKWYGRIYAIRLYDRILTSEERQRNAAIDNIRFIGDKPDDRLDVTTDPSCAWAVVTPGQEGRSGLTDGQEVLVSATDVSSSDVRATCTGWKLFDRDGNLVGSGDSASFTYRHPNPAAYRRLEWQHDVLYRVTASGVGATYAPVTQWVEKDARAVIAFTPEDGTVFYSVSGDWEASVSGTNLVTGPVRGPLDLTLAYQPQLFVDKDGDDENGTGDADEPFECAWRRLFEKFRSPKTGLLYEHLPDEMPGAVERYLPTPDEVARNEPIATGWNTGMEDGVLNGCPLILAAMARKDKRAVELLVPGVLRCATISSVPGFLARSILPADGRSHYVNSSRDQYTLFVYTMWRYANSDFCAPGRRAEIVRIVTDIARFTRRCVRKEHGYDILREDGKQGIVCTMWMDNPWGPLVTNAVGRVGRGNVLAHEVGRLPMIYAAAYALTGDKAWRECELEVADAALRIQEFDPLKSYQGFMFLQMQVSQRLLWECESDPVRRARYLKMLRRIARASRAGMDCAEGLFAELGGDLSAPAGDWRHWKRELVMGGDGMYNGLPYRMPIRPDAYQKAYRCVVELGDAVIVPLLCPDCQLEPDYLERFLRLSRKADFAHVMSPGLVYPVLAREMIRERADAARSVAAAGGPSGERLYNGIELPRDWPPREFSSLTRETQRVPYLEERPDVVSIDVGRQLFVDDFLIETTSLRREWHYPEKYEGNPVLRPETPLEINRPSNSTARVSSGGVWWDPKRKKYRMWYEAGFCSAAAYAESDDGLHWRRVDLDVVPGTNRLFPEGTMRFDTWVVTPDFAAEDPYANWRLFVRPPGPDAMCAFVAESPDGLHWSEFREVGLCGDASLCCYNPFRRKWVFSLRNELGPWGLGGSRVRSYREASDFLAGANGSFRLGESGGKMARSSRVP